jgi:adenylate cyclase
LLGKVQVKGKTSGISIYTVKRELTSLEQDLWGGQNDAMDLFYDREFEKAGKRFEQLLKNAPDDVILQNMIEETKLLQANPPEADWDGVVIMKTK